MVACIYAASSNSPTRLRWKEAFEFTAHEAEATEFSSSHALSLSNNDVPLEV
jgi:hypothetical protein